MTVLLHYHQHTGAIRGVYSASNRALLETQPVPSDPDEGHLLLETDLAAETLQARFEVRHGELVAKIQLTIEADPLTFLADGLDECLVTVEPWHACTVLVNEVPYALTDDDPLLLLTSDVPHVFQIALMSQPGFWAESLSVEARADA